MGRALKKLLLPAEEEIRATKTAGQIAAKDALPQAGLQDAGECFSKLFTGSQRSLSRKFFGEVKMDQLRAELKRRPEGFLSLVGFLRKADLFPLECKPRAVHTDPNFQRLLYTCLLPQLRPVQVPADGNCFFHSIATIIFGRADLGHHKLIRALCLAFFLLFEGHIKLLIRADSPGMALGEAAVQTEYEELCWSVFRLKSWANKFSLYAVSWLLDRSVYLYLSCFHWNRERSEWDVAKPRGGVEVDTSQAALRAAFAGQGDGNSELPSFVQYSALHSRPNRLPAIIFLDNDHYVPLLLRKSTEPRDVVHPRLLCWKESLSAVSTASPLPKDDAQLRTFVSDQ